MNKYNNSFYRKVTRTTNNAIHEKKVKVEKEIEGWLNRCNLHEKIMKEAEEGNNSINIEAPSYLSISEVPKKIQEKVGYNFDIQTIRDGNFADLFDDEDSTHKFKISW